MYGPEQQPRYAYDVEFAPQPRARREEIADKTMNGRRNEEAHCGIAEQNGRLLARGELPFGRTDLSPRQSPAAGAAEIGAREAHAAGTLGHDPGAELHLCALKPGHQEIRPRHDLRLRP